MKRILVVFIFTLSIANLVAAQELVAKFDSVTASSDDMNVEITWRLSGIWPREQVHNIVYARAEATYVCLDRSGRMKVADHENQSELLRPEADFTASRKGTARGKLLLRPPSVGMFTCAPDQDLQLACASYSDLVCRDDTHDLDRPIKQRFVTYKPGYAEFCALDLR